MKGIDYIGRPGCEMKLRAFLVEIGYRVTRNNPGLHETVSDNYWTKWAIIHQSEINARLSFKTEITGIIDSRS